MSERQATLYDYWRPSLCDRVRIALGLVGMEATLARDAPAPYRAGECLSFADISLVSQIASARRWGVDLASCQRLAAISERLEVLPAFILAHPDAMLARQKTDSLGGA